LPWKSGTKLRPCIWSGTGIPARSSTVGALSTFTYPAPAYRSCLHHAGTADHPRYSQRLLVHKTLIEPAMIAEKETVIPGEDHNGVLGEAALVQIVEQASHVVVLRLQGPQKTLHELLIIPLFALPFGQFGGRMKIRHFRNPHPGFARRRGAQRIVVVERSRFRNPYIIVDMFVLMRWFERTMIAEELHHHEEWLRELFDPLDDKIHFVVCDVSGIALLHNLALPSSAFRR